MTREFTIAVEVTAVVDIEWEEMETDEIQQCIDGVALNVIGAVLEHNPEYEVRRLRSVLLESWV